MNQLYAAVQAAHPEAKATVVGINNETDTMVIDLGKGELKFISIHDLSTVGVDSAKVDKLLKAGTRIVLTTVFPLLVVKEKPANSGTGSMSAAKRTI
jgi:hypothetical protein